MSRRQRLSRRDLSGWTHTGGAGCSGREGPPLAGGGIDWSRPRCEPDNRLHVQLGRAAAVFVPLLGALPVIWLGLAANQWLLRSGFPGWVADQDWHTIGYRVLCVLAVAAASCLGAYLGKVWPAAPQRMPARVDVSVASTHPVPAYPVGQLVVRRLDTTALLPSTRHAVPEVAALPSAEDPGRWSA